MNDPNPYRSPDAQVVPVDLDGDLAGRGVRLGAAILDAIILVVILTPLMYFGGYIGAAMAAAQAGQQVGLGLQLLWALVGLVVFLVVQGYPLHTAGQTWGKKALGIRIVDLAGNKPSFATLWGKRYFPVQVVSAIPFIGGLAVLVEVLLIFRDDRRCGHDLIAGTRVVRVR